MYGDFIFVTVESGPPPRSGSDLLEWYRFHPYKAVGVRIGCDFVKSCLQYSRSLRNDNKISRQ